MAFAALGIAPDYNHVRIALTGPFFGTSDQDAANTLAASIFGNDKPDELTVSLFTKPVML